MTDAPLETSVPVTTTPPTPPLPNDPASRTADGTIKDAQTPTAPTTTDKVEEKSVAEPPRVPEKYEFKPAEGQSIDDAVVSRFTPIFKELNLTQNQAQKLFDAYSAQSKTSADATVKAVNDMREGWRNDIAKDPDMGPKVDAIKAEIGRAKSTIFENDPKGLEAFNEAMNLTGAGDHPAIAKAWWKMAQRINEGTHVSGRGPSEQGQSAPDRAARPSAAQSIYPNLPSATRPTVSH